VNLILFRAAQLLAPSPCCRPIRQLPQQLLYTSNDCAGLAVETRAPALAFMQHDTEHALPARVAISLPLVCRGLAQDSPAARRTTPGSGKGPDASEMQCVKLDRARKVAAHEHVVWMTTRLSCHQRARSCDLAAIFSFLQCDAPPACYLDETPAIVDTEAHSPRILALTWSVPHLECDSPAWLRCTDATPLD